jgi:hypothetical protein
LDILKEVVKKNIRKALKNCFGLYICKQNFLQMEHTHDTQEQKKGLWYTYLGETGAAVVAFLYLTIIFFCIFSILRWG